MLNVRGVYAMKLGEKLDQLKSKERAYEKILEVYPDVELKVDRWNREYLCSPSVNTEAKEVLMKFNCGCCADSPLQAMPYVKVEGQTIWSEPQYFFVGDPFNYDGVLPKKGWKERMRAKNISEEVISKVEASLRARFPRFDPDDEDDAEDYELVGDIESYFT